MTERRKRRKISHSSGSMKYDALVKLRPTCFEKELADRQAQRTSGHKSNKSKVLIGCIARAPSAAKPPPEKMLKGCSFCGKW
jgi:hypothetical protein